jgi:hypothetical protein
MFLGKSGYMKTKNPQNALGRYFLCALPGFVLLLSGFLHFMRPSTIMRIVSPTLSLLLIILSYHTYFDDNWRSVIQDANQLSLTPQSIIFIQSGLIESEQLNWLNDTEKQSYLLAPLALYKIKARAIPLPNQINSITETYMDRISNQILRDVDHFILIQCGTIYCQPLAEKFQSFGFKAQPISDYGSLKLFVYDR